MLISHALLYIFDDSPLAPICPSNELNLADGVSAYLGALKRRLEASEERRDTRLREESLVLEALRGENDAFSRSNAFVQAMYTAMQRKDIVTRGFDVITYTFEEAQEQYFAMFYLPYRGAYVHTVAGTGAHMENALVKNRYILPGAGSKGVAGAIVRLGTGEITLKDAVVQTQSGEGVYFGEAVLGCENAKSTLEMVEAVEEIACRVAQAQQSAEGEYTQEEQNVRRVMAASMEQNGALDMQYIAEEVFASDSERMERFQAAVEEAGIAPVVPVASTKLKNAFEKIRLATDNGVSITLPRAVADDESSFSIRNNPDGSISIELRNIQSIEAK